MSEMRNLDLIKSEYEKLKDEVIELEKDLHESERYGLTGYFATYALVLLDPEKNLTSLGRFPWFVPSIIIAILVVKTFTNGMRIKVIENYLAVVEQKCFGDDTLGWESLNRRQHQWPSFVYGGMSLALYLALFFLALIVAVRVPNVVK